MSTGFGMGFLELVIIAAIGVFIIGPILAAAIIAFGGSAKRNDKR